MKGTPNVKISEIGEIFADPDNKLVHCRFHPDGRIELDWEKMREHFPKVYKEVLAGKVKREIVREV